MRVKKAFGSSEAVWPIELPEEEKRRIEQEELARLDAEQKYRDQVRRSLRGSNERAPAVLQTERRGGHGGCIAVALIALIAIGVWQFSSGRARSNNDSVKDAPAASVFTQWTPLTVDLVSGQYQVRAHDYIFWNFEVPSVSVRGYHVTGHYSAIGGGGNDIQAVIATDEDFQNWINGHASRVFYASPGRVTTGNIDVILPAGKYVIAFSNTFSLVSEKAVDAEIKATYQQAK